MSLEMKIPSPGESITEVEIAQWLVESGDYVETDQIIAEIDSDKATLELPCEVAGTITRVAAEGDDLAIGALIAYIETDGVKDEKKESNANAPAKSEIKPPVIKEVPKPVAAPAAVAEQKAKSTYAEHHVSPAARKILEEKE